MPDEVTYRLPSKQLAQGYDYLAPDLSEIRLLVDGGRAGLAHCTLPAGRVSRAVRHQTVEELWYVLGGEGAMWRSLDGADEILPVCTGSSLTVAPGARFQFRSGAAAPLQILIATVPRWPGASEALPTQGRWPSA